MRVKDIEGVLAECAGLHHTIGIQQVELNKVKELNREMVEALRDIQAFVMSISVYVPSLTQLSSYEAVMKHTQTILAKADRV